VLQKAGIGGQGGGVPFAIEGTTSDPKFVPNVKAIAGNAMSRKVSGEAERLGLIGERRRYEGTRATKDGSCPTSPEETLLPPSLCGRIPPTQKKYITRLGPTSTLRQQLEERLWP
jgi:hypothetical protein